AGSDARSLTPTTHAGTALSQSLGEMLVSSGVVTEPQLREAMAFQRNGSVRLGEALLKLGFVDEATLTRTLAKQSGIPFVDLDKGKIAPEILARVPKEVAQEQGIVPLMEKNGKLVVAVDDPLKRILADQLRFMLGIDVACALAGPTALKRALGRAYGESADV